MIVLSNIKFADNWIAILSAVVALTSATATIAFSRSKNRREEIEFQIKYFENLRKWADAAAFALTEAIHLCYEESEGAQREGLRDSKRRLQITLSHLTDTGRWFFPNIEIKDVGSYKEIGYRGYRHEVLDGLVVAYRCISHLNHQSGNGTDQIKVQLIDAKRHFVGQVQKVLDPGTLLREFDQITHRRAGRSKLN